LKLRQYSRSFFYYMFRIPLHIIELEHENYHILIEGKFGDGTSSSWIIDTGASKTVLDSNLGDFYEKVESDNDYDYQSAGINQEALDTTVGKISSLLFEDFLISDLKVALINLKHVNDIYTKYTPYTIAGLIGGDLLMKYRCKIDYKKRVIIFNKEARAQKQKK
jgi:hypothetical protein